MRYKDMSDKDLDKATRDVRDAIESAQKSRRMFEDKGDTEGVASYDRIIEDKQRDLDDLMQEHSRRISAP